MKIQANTFPSVTNLGKTLVPAKGNPVDRFTPQTSHDKSSRNLKEFLTFGARAAAAAVIPCGLAVAASQAGASGAGALGVAAGMTALPCLAVAMIPHIFSGGENHNIESGTFWGIATVVGGSVALATLL